MAERGLRGRPLLVYLRTMAVFAAVWAALALWTANPVLLPTPLAAFEAVVELARSLELFEHAAISLGRMALSLFIAAGIAIPLGLLMGLNRELDALVDPTVELLRPISGIAWIPLALFIFGIGNALPVFIMTYAAFFPILLGTIAGVRSVDARLIDAARTMGVPRRRIVTHVVVPAALPALLVAVAARRRHVVDRCRGGRADRRPKRRRLCGRVVSRAADDPPGHGVHRDDRLPRLSDRQPDPRAHPGVHPMGGGHGERNMSALLLSFPRRRESSVASVQR